MKIALVHQPIGAMFLPIRGGSIEIWIYETARRLAKKFDVIVYAPMTRHQRKVEHDQNVHYRRISISADKWFTYVSTVVDKLLRCTPVFRKLRHPLFASRLYYMMYFLQVARDLRAEKCDIVHVHNFSQCVPVIRAYNPKIKIVLHMHCEWLTQLDRSMIERRLSEVDLVIGCSKYITEKIRCRFPRFAKRCQTIYNGVDINRFFIKNGQRVINKSDIKRLLFVGRVSPEKGLHILLDAFQKVIKCHPKIHLEIVGPQGQLPLEWLIALSNDYKVSNLSAFYHGFSTTSYFTHLQRQILSLNISSHVTFTDFVQYEDMINNYRSADLLVNPSLSEAFGRSLIEVMACQVPVVATRVGGMREIVEEGRTGILVDPGDSNALAQAIIHLLSDEDLKASMGRIARNRAAELFSWDHIVENLLRQYEKTCEN